MAFAFGLLFNEKINQNFSSYFLFEIKHVTLYANKTKIKSHIKLIQCTKDHFFNSINKNFDLLGLDKFSCIDKSLYNDITSSLIIEGIYTSEIIQYIEYSVIANQTAIDENYAFQNIFNENVIKMQFYYLDSSINISNYDTPEQLFIDSKYIQLSFPFVFKANIDFGKNTFNSDANILFPSDSIFYFYKPSLYENMAFFIGNNQFNDMFNDFNLFGRMYIRSSNKNIIMRRVYQKFTEFLADATSIPSQLLIMIMIIISAYDKFRAEECIIDNIIRSKEKMIRKTPGEYNLLRKLFNNQTIKSHDSLMSKDSDNNIKHKRALVPHNNNYFQQKSSINTTIKPLFLSEKGLLSHFNNETNKQQNNSIVSNNNTLHMPFKKFIGNYRPNKDPLLNKVSLKYTTCELTKAFLMKIGCKSNIEIKEMIFDKEMKYFIYHLDIISYFSKMREIDLIKYFLLNKHENNLINFLSKPSITSFINKNDSSIINMTSKDTLVNLTLNDTLVDMTKDTI